MLQIALFALLVNSGPPKVVPLSPVLGARCYQSRDVFALGYGNIPASSGRETSVVNIWLIQKGGKPVAWIYKNFSKQYWIQVNSLEYAGQIRHAFPASVANLLLRGATKHTLPIPYRMPSLGVYDRYFAKFGAARADCFTGDLPSKYL